MMKLNIESDLKNTYIGRALYIATHFNSFIQL